MTRVGAYERRGEFNPRVFAKVSRHNLHGCPHSRFREHGCEHSGGGVAHGTNPEHHTYIYKASTSVTPKRSQLTSHYFRSTGAREAIADDDGTRLAVAQVAEVVTKPQSQTNFERNAFGRRRAEEYTLPRVFATGEFLAADDVAEVAL